MARMNNPKYFKPELNTPYTVALKYPTAKQVDGFAGPELRWILADGRAFYTPLDFAAKIEDSGIRPGQQFIVEKRVVGRNVEWSIRKQAPVTPREGQPAAALLAHSEALDAPVIEGDVGASPTRLEAALKTAVAAAASAEKHAERLGYSCRFSSADIRALGISAFIDSGHRNAA